MSTVAPTTTQTIPAAAVDHPAADDVAVRAVGAVALAALALIHVEDLPDTWGDSKLVGGEFVLLIAAALALGGAVLVRRVGLRLWLAVGALAGSALLGYVVSRTIGIPGDDDDIGNWRCPLGLATLTVEVIVLALAAWVTIDMVRRRAAAGSRS